jgi:hypothetical protein
MEMIACKRKDLSHDLPWFLLFFFAFRAGLAANGTITPGSNAAAVGYTYDPLTGNTNARTVQYFSSTANERMRQDGDSSKSFYESFQKFADYYGDATYGDKWVTAAFNAGTTSFSSNRGDADFSSFDYAARAGTFDMRTNERAIRFVTIGILAARALPQPCWIPPVFLCRGHQEGDRVP